MRWRGLHLTDVETIRLGNYDIPPINTEKDTPEDAETVKSKIQEAEAIVLGTPMYHGSYSGTLKCAIDHCGFDEFEDKTVGLVAVSGGSFPTSALSHLRIVCRALNAWVLPKQLGVPNVYDNVDDGSGKLINDGYRDRAESIGEKMVKYSIEEKDITTNLGDENEGA